MHQWQPSSVAMHVTSCLSVGLSKGTASQPAQPDEASSIPSTTADRRGNSCIPGNMGTGRGRLTAVHAYRQAREAAIRAAGVSVLPCTLASTGLSMCGVVDNSA